MIASGKIKSPQSGQSARYNDGEDAEEESLEGKPGSRTVQDIVVASKISARTDRGKRQNMESNIVDSAQQS